MAGLKGNSNSIGWLSMIFQAVQSANMATIVRNDTSPITNIYVSLHTADPLAAGAQNTSESAYTGYARQAVARTTGGWTIASQTISNAAIITFPLCTGGSETLTHASVGTLLSGAGVMLWSGPLTASLAVSNGITPSFAIGALTFTEG